MHESFRNALAETLQTPAEQMGALDQTVSLLEYGAQSIIESTLPALVNQYLQQNFGEVLESYMPGIHQSFTEATLANVWDGVRGDDLPPFGSEQFNQLAAKVNAEHPELADLDFHDAQGRPLPVMEALAKKAAITAQLCRGLRFSPESYAEAVQRGKSSAETNNRRVSAGRALNSGRTSGKIGQTESFTSLRDAYNERNPAL